MLQLLSVVPVILLLAFYLWMFRDMTRNEHLMTNPWAFLGVGRADPRQPTLRSNWTFAFLILNVVAAVLYYTTEYHPRR